MSVETGGDLQVAVLLYLRTAGNGQNPDLSRSVIGLRVQSGPVRGASGTVRGCCVQFGRIQAARVKLFMLLMKPVTRQHLITDWAK